MSDELRATIGRAISDIIDAVNTYAAGQIALAVTPRPPTGEPLLCPSDYDCPECPESAEGRLKRLTRQSEGYDSMVMRCYQLGRLAKTVLDRFAFPPDVMLEARATVGVQELGHWKMILDGKVCACPEPLPVTVEGKNDTLCCRCGKPRSWIV